MIYNDPSGEYAQLMYYLPKVLSSLERGWKAVHKFWKDVKWRLWTVSINNVWPNLARHRKAAEDLGHFIYKVTHQSKKSVGDKAKTKKEWKSSSCDPGDYVNTPDTNRDDFTRWKVDWWLNGWTVWRDNDSWNIWSREKAWKDTVHWWSAWKVSDKWTKKPKKEKRKTISDKGKVLRN